MKIKPLPRRPPPFDDELLSSWITRLAKANHCAVKELCGYLGFEQGRAPETIGELGQTNLGAVSFAVQRTVDEVSAMTLPDGVRYCIRYVAEGNFQHCPECTAQTPGLVLRHWRYVWSTACEMCGRELIPHTADAESEFVSGKLTMRAMRGAEVLKSTFSGGDSQLGRRFSRAFHLMCAMDMAERRSLTSNDKAARFATLAAIGTCMPLQMPKSPSEEPRHAAAVRHLTRIFPQQREVIEKIIALSGISDEHLAVHFKGKAPSQQHTKATSRTKASTRALAAARQAIEELGPTADRYKLLTRADAIWTLEKQLVDVR